MALRGPGRRRGADDGPGTPPGQPGDDSASDVFLQTPLQPWRASDRPRPAPVKAAPTSGDDTDLSALRAENDALHTQADAMHAENEALHAEVDSLRQQLASHLHDTASANEAEQRRLQDERDQRASETAAWTTERNSWRTERGGWAVERGTLQARIDELLAQGADHRDSRTHALDDATRRVDALTDRLRGLGTA